MPPPSGCVANALIKQGQRVDSRILINNVVALNGGDQAILDGIVRELARYGITESDILVSDKNADRVRQMLPFKVSTQLADQVRDCQSMITAPLVRVQRRLFWKRLKIAAQSYGWRRRMLGRLLAPTGVGSVFDYWADVAAVISTGGTYLVDRYGVASRLRELEMFQWLGKPVALYTQSIGPLTSQSSREHLGRVLRRADAVLLRDAVSRDLVIELGADPDVVRVSADAAFSLANEGALARRKRAGWHFPDCPRVSISVRHWKYFEAPQGGVKFQEAVAALCQHLVRDYGARVRFLSTCQGEESYVTDDSDEALQITTRLPKDVQDSVTVETRRYSPQELISAYQEDDFVIATRMHAAILALCAATPVLPIAYEFKTRELAKKLRLPQPVPNIDNISGTALCAIFDKYCGWYESAATEVFERVIAEAQDATAAAHFVVEQLKLA